MEPETAFASQESKNFDREEDWLREDFPQFQDGDCADLLEEVCDSHGNVEGFCCLRKRRRIMQDAAPLADAWESADKLKKIFRRGALPRHFQSVLRFLEK